MRLDFRLLDVFTDRPFAGNQLAVVLDAGGLDEGLMQDVTREFNFAETTFVMGSRVPGCDHRVRIFTPAAEIPMAGHPTVGTALVLQREGHQGDLITFELGVGPTPVRLAADRATMRQQPPEFARCGTGCGSPRNWASSPPRSTGARRWSRRAFPS